MNERDIAFVRRFSADLGIAKEVLLDTSRVDRQHSQTAMVVRTAERTFDLRGGSIPLAGQINPGFRSCLCSFVSDVWKVLSDICIACGSLQRPQLSHCSDSNPKAYYPEGLLSRSCFRLPSAGSCDDGSCLALEGNYPPALRV